MSLLIDQMVVLNENQAEKNRLEKARLQLEEEKLMFLRSKNEEE